MGPFSQCNQLVETVPITGTVKGSCVQVERKLNCYLRMLYLEDGGSCQELFMEHVFAFCQATNSSNISMCSTLIGYSIAVQIIPLLLHVRIIADLDKSMSDNQGHTVIYKVTHCNVYDIVSTKEVKIACFHYQA